MKPAQVLDKDKNIDDDQMFDLAWFPQATMLPWNFVDNCTHVLGSFPAKKDESNDSWMFVLTWIPNSLVDDDGSCL